MSFEGIDGAGKSTLVPLVKKALDQRAVPTFFTREETPTFLGDTVRRAVTEAVDPLAIVHLFLADRIQHLQALRAPLDEGSLVATDRYHDSTRAYQGVALAERFGGVDRFDAWLQEVSEDWLVVPARTYLLDIDAAAALARLGSRSEKGGYEKLDFLEKVRARYLELAAGDPERWVVLDAEDRPGQLVDEVMADLEKQGLVPAEPLTKDKTADP